MKDERVEKFKELLAMCEECTMNNSSVLMPVDITNIPLASTTRVTWTNTESLSLL